jgi:hypothetical protein
MPVDREQHRHAGRWWRYTDLPRPGRPACQIGGARSRILALWAAVHRPLSRTRDVHRDCWSASARPAQRPRGAARVYVPEDGCGPIPGDRLFDLDLDARTSRTAVFRIRLWGIPLTLRRHHLVRDSFSRVLTMLRFAWIPTAARPITSGPSTFSTPSRDSKGSTHWYSADSSHMASATTR